MQIINYSPLVTANTLIPPSNTPHGFLAVVYDDAHRRYDMKVTIEYIDAEPTKVIVWCTAKVTPLTEGAFISIVEVRQRCRKDIWTVGALLAQFTMLAYSEHRARLEHLATAPELPLTPPPRYTEPTRDTVPPSADPTDTDLLPPLRSDDPLNLHPTST
jgi:hypothetical protein